LLAQGVLNVIIRNHKNNFKDFLNSARKYDAGEEASKKYLGVSLGQIATTYKGSGKWSPSQTYLEGYFNG
jgi:hypothetical protein